MQKGSRFAEKMKNYLLFGGISKEEYDQVHPSVAAANHKSLTYWSVLVSFFWIYCLVMSLNAEDYKMCRPAYTAALGGKGNVNFFPGLGGAIREAEQTGAETVYVTDRVNQPYIFALFYTQTPPETFADSVVYRNPNGAFRHVERFSGFEFADPDLADVEVRFAWDAGGREVLARSGQFVVCR